jgi:glycosyltransferase involved in cell wall biosynthesis
VAPGERNDVPDILRGLDCFVLPSLGEGISNTILEAMATGLPVIATHVGGNGELVDAGTTGSSCPRAIPMRSRNRSRLCTRPRSGEGRRAQRASAYRTRVQPRRNAWPLRTLYDRLLTADSPSAVRIKQA